MKAWMTDALTGTSGVTSMGRVLLLATVGTHLTLVVVDVVWRLAYIATVGRTPQPAYPAFSQQIALYLSAFFVVWVAGARWARAWKETGLTGAISKTLGAARDSWQSWRTTEYETGPVTETGAKAADLIDAGGPDFDAYASDPIGADERGEGDE